MLLYVCYTNKSSQRVGLYSLAKTSTVGPYCISAAQRLIELQTTCHLKQTRQQHRVP